MRHKTTQTVFAYFNRVRGGKAVPLRADIDPVVLKSVLPDVFFLEMERTGRPVFRLAGTRVCTILGKELRGENFIDLWHVPNRHKMKLAVEAVLANQAPVSVDVLSIAEEEREGELEMLLMPLASRPGVCDRVFGALGDLSKPPLSGERSRILKAKSLSFVTHAPSPPPAQMESEPLSVVATQGASRARVMHLRVIDGGRKD